MKVSVSKTFFFVFLEAFLHVRRKAAERAFPGPPFHDLVRMRSSCIVKDQLIYTKLTILSQLTVCL
jgi:hypothetical protein